MMIKIAKSCLQMAPVFMAIACTRNIDTKTIVYSAIGMLVFGFLIVTSKNL